jgi:hypothetical protein
MHGPLWVLYFQNYRPPSNMPFQIPTAGLGKPKR